MKKVAVKLLVISLLVVLLVGCGSSSTKQIPEIVFMCFTDYSDLISFPYTPDPLYKMTFLDKNGNLYFTDNPYVCKLKYKELVTEYEAGNLEGKIEFRTSCDENVLAEKYKELLKVAANKEYEIVYPELIPEVVDVRIHWYGIFYDKDGEPHFIDLHRKEYSINLDSNDETANALYKWYAELEAQGKK